MYIYCIILLLGEKVMIQFTKLHGLVCMQWIILIEKIRRILEQY